MNKYKKMFYWILAAIVLIIFCSYVYIVFERDKEFSSFETILLLDVDIDVYDVLLNGAQGSIENAQRQDVLRDCPSVLHMLRFGTEEITSDTLGIIDCYMNQYYEYGYLPREPYDSVPGGDYVTAMDAPLLAVCCELAYERIGDEKYKQFLNDLIPYLVADTKESGFILKENDDCWWPLEYAWNDITTEDAWYVYNGSLYGLVCIELIAKCTGDERLIELSDKALNSYKEHADEFYYSDENWCWYSLNYTDGNPIIDRSEKLFIEIRALKALYILTGEEFYNNEYEKRIDIWNDIYPVYLYENDNSFDVIFLCAGAPHPYYIDIYPTILEIYDSENNLIKTIEAPERSAEYAFIREDITEEAKYYKLYAKINDIKNTLITEGELVYTDHTDLKEPEYQYSFWGDCANFDETTISLNKDISELEKAIIEFDFDEVYSNDSESYFIFDITNESQCEYAIQVMMTDENENTMYRYLQTIKPGNNSLIFNYLGFRYTDTCVENVSKIRIDFITSGMETTEGEITLNKFYFCDSTYQVVEYLDDKKYTDFWYYK